MRSCTKFHQNPSILNIIFKDMGLKITANQGPADLLVLDGFCSVSNFSETLAI